MKCIGMRCNNPGSTIVSSNMNNFPDFSSSMPIFKQKDLGDNQINNLRGPY